MTRGKIKARAAEVVVTVAWCAGLARLSVANILAPGQLMRAEVEADAFRRGAEAMRAAAIAACVKQSNEMMSTAGALGCDFCEDAIEDLPLPEVTK